MSREICPQQWTRGSKLTNTVYNLKLSTPEKPMFATMDKMSQEAINKVYQNPVDLTQS